MTTCYFGKNDTPKFIFCLKKGTPKNGTSRTCIYGSYPPPPGLAMGRLVFCRTACVARYHFGITKSVMTKIDKALSCTEISRTGGISTGDGVTAQSFSKR